MSRLRKHSLAVIQALAISLLSGACVTASRSTSAEPSPQITRPGQVVEPGHVPAVIDRRLDGIRVPFVANHGQIDRRVAYYAPTFAGTLFVTDAGELIYALPNRRSGLALEKLSASMGSDWSLTESLRDGDVRPVGQERSATGVSYFLGNDPAGWHAHIPTYDALSLGEVWPGIGVSLRARGRSIEKVFTVSPGASVDRIRIDVGGARTLTVDSAGGLVAHTEPGPVRFTPPVAYQERNGVRRSIPVAYAVRGHEYGFTAGEYDATLPLVIDPLLQSTYLGGSAEDTAYAVAIHPTTGDVYVAGATYSGNFPKTSGGAQSTFGSPLFCDTRPMSDAFVARLDSTLTTLAQSTYLGGTGSDTAYALAIHPTNGDVYVAGNTASSNFPGTTGGAQPTYASPDNPCIGGDGFVARLTSSLTGLTQATYLGGSRIDRAYGLAIHPATGHLYVTGETSSSDFPGTIGGAQVFLSEPFTTNAFVARVAGDLKSLIQASYLGGGGDIAFAVGIGPTTGDVYLAGYTASTNFPGTIGGAQPNPGGRADPSIGDAFVARLPSSLTALTQATYLGAWGYDRAYALAIHPGTADVYVAGVTSSLDFPGTAGGVQPHYGWGHLYGDAFVAYLSSDLTLLRNATYLGGTGDDRAWGLAIDPGTANVYVSGLTDSSDFPGAIAAGTFVARLNQTLTALQATSFGDSAPFGDGTAKNAVTIHPSTGEIYVAGGTASTTFPQTVGGAQPTYGGGISDAFVTRLTFAGPLMGAGATVTFVTSQPPTPVTLDPGLVLFQGTNLVSATVSISMGFRSGDTLSADTTGTAIVAAYDSGSGILSLIGTDTLAHYQAVLRTVAFTSGITASINSRRTILWHVDDGLGGSNSATSTVIVVRTARDFNGDGRADALWRATSGDLVMWLMNGGSITSEIPLGEVATTWTIVGIGDFNNDGKADILWRDSSGNVALWLMNAGTVTAALGLGNVPTTWIAHVGDYNSDGHADILWRDASGGGVFLWLMNNGTITSNLTVGAVPTNWTIIGTGDFDGDGKTDLLWRSDAGNVSLWLMSGGTATASLGLGNIPNAWLPYIGDFDGDGRADILWRHTASGNLALWLMREGTVLAQYGLGAVPTTWTLERVSDFNGDGRVDILWQDSSGNVALWLMNGPSAIGVFAVRSITPGVWSTQ